MRGRKKNRAEKYDPDMDLSELSERAWKGRFHGEPVWEHILEFFEVYEPDWDKIDRDEFYEKYPDASPQKMILEWCRMMLERRDIDGFQRLTEMMKTAVELKARGAKAVDPLRSAILQGNSVLYEKIFQKTKYKGEAKKADLLKYLRKSHEDIFREVEDADIFKMMRKMGVPRRPYCFTEANQRVIDAWRRAIKKVGK